MVNNDILKKLRYIFDYGDDKMMSIFAKAGKNVDRPLLSSWLKKEEDPDFIKIEDKDLAYFLAGFIIAKRGAKDGEAPLIEDRLNNNIILRKLKIALNFKDEDIIATLKAADFNLGKPELSAFFRHPSAPQYRTCKDQILRNFLMGLQLQNPRKAES